MCVCVVARSSELLQAFGHLYQQQYAVALFNSIRFDVEGGGGPQAQLLQRKVASPSQTSMDWPPSGSQQTSLSLCTLGFNFIS